jgi:hypothetical protein
VLMVWLVWGALMVFIGGCTWFEHLKMAKRAVRDVEPGAQTQTTRESKTIFQHLKE